MSSPTGQFLKTSSSAWPKDGSFHSRPALRHAAAISSMVSLSCARSGSRNGFARASRMRWDSGSNASLAAMIAASIAAASALVSALGTAGSDGGVRTLSAPPPLIGSVTTTSRSSAAAADACSAPTRAAVTDAVLAALSGDDAAPLPPAATPLAFTSAPAAAPFGSTGCLASLA